jgi:hypothetical protein
MPIHNLVWRTEILTDQTSWSPALVRHGLRWRRCWGCPPRTLWLGSAPDSKRTPDVPSSLGARQRWPRVYSMSVPISFPFERDKFYSIGELRAFQTKLSEARQQDPVVTASIRARKLPWAKLCCEELFPIMLFADLNRSSLMQVRSKAA